MFICGMLFVSLQLHLLLCWHGFYPFIVTLSKKTIDKGLIPRNWPRQFQWPLNIKVQLPGKARYSTFSMDLQQISDYV